MKKTTSTNSNFAEGEALAVEAGDMLNGMVAGATKSMFRKKIFWGILGGWAVFLGGSAWFLVWAVQTIADKL